MSTTLQLVQPVLLNRILKAMEASYSVSTSSWSDILQPRAAFQILLADLGVGDPNIYTASSERSVSARQSAYTFALIAFIMQLILALLSTILVLSQKFSVPEEPGKWCGLQDRGENEWGFGQTLSVVMLLLPGMSAAQAYLEGRQDIREGRRG